MAYFFFSIVFGFLAAAILTQILRSVLRFHAEWTSMFIACMLTCFVSGVALACAVLCVDKHAEFEELKVYGPTFAASFLTGLFAFRLIIKSESGRSLGWVGSAFISFALSTAPLVLQGIVSLFAASTD